MGGGGAGRQPGRRERGGWPRWQYRRPVHVYGARISPLADRTDQCFGHCNGRIRDDRGQDIVVEQLLGWAEDVHINTSALGL
ncbi:DUF2804 family protein [Streptomyces sp. NPDC005151]